MGDEMRFAALSLMVRDPVPEPVPAGAHAHWQLWHREGGGVVNPGHPKCIHTMMVLFYLNDSDPSTHSFSVVPEALTTKQAHTIAFDERTGTHFIDEPFVGQSRWRSVRRTDSVDVHGKAGTCVITNGSNPHAGVVRQTSKEYAKVLLWYSFGPQSYVNSSVGRLGPKTVPHHSAHGDKDYTVPQRLWDQPDIRWLLEAAEEETWTRVSSAEELPKEQLQPTLAVEERVNAAKRSLSPEGRRATLEAAAAAAKL